MVRQEHCAMKVCTDACIQGAHAAAFLKNEMERSGKKKLEILDIGTGTGLLALMIAQEIENVHIDAIELDAAACLQTGNNFIHSPWPEKLSIFQGDIRVFHSEDKYDFIICNPPFYEHDLKSDHLLKNQAKHSVMLSHQELLRAIVQNLSAEGRFCVMLPVKQSAAFRSMTEEQDLYPRQILSIKHSPDHADSRNIIYFTKGKQETKEDRLCIADETGGYTLSFKTLLEKYYLHF